MAVALLRGENFRLYRKFQIEPNPQLNLIVGDNAAGKTTLLEALFVATRGRSFRAQNLAELCGPTGQSWNSYFDFKQDGKQHQVGIGWTRSGVDLRLDLERNARVSDVLRAVPLQLIEPLAHRLLDDGPSYRRSFIDWGVFHVEHSFLGTWRRYQRALKQRNKALRGGLGVDAIRAWDAELVAHGEVLNDMRERHVEATNSAFSAWTKRLMGTSETAIDWHRGWPTDQTLQDCLERNIDQHQSLGTTAQGPHRAELKIRFEETRARGRVSRGQQKMLIAAMVMAQAEILISEGVPAPILLLDDFSSELAPEFQARLAEALLAYRGQKFVTTFEVPAAFSRCEGAMFHVEQGTVRAIDRIH